MYNSVAMYNWFLNLHKWIVLLRVCFLIYCVSESAHILTLTFSFIVVVLLGTASMYTKATLLKFTLI